MKENSIIRRNLLTAAALAGICWFALCAAGQDAGATNKPLSAAEEQAAKIKARWTRELDGVLRESRDSNDQETAGFVSGLLASLDQPQGMSPVALADDLERIKIQVRELVRRGARESAARLNYAQVMVSYTPNFGPPLHPNNRTGGSPGPSGLVLYYSFDRPADKDVIHDESGAGNDGYLFGAQWVPDGKFGGAYHFSLTNFSDRIVVPNSELLNPEEITVSAWIKATTWDGFWHRILDKDCWHGYCLSLAGDDNHGKGARGRLRYEGFASIGADPVLDDNRWHHVAASYDGKVVRCYVDGDERSHAVKNPGPMKKTPWDLCIGNSVVNYGTDELLAFDGWIDEVRIYNRALAAAEIKSLATATRAGADVLSGADGAPAKADPAERLKKLKSLYDQGLINKEEYDKKVKEIMDAL